MKTFSATRQVGEERRLLVDDGDARVACVGGAVESRRLAVDQDAARVGLVTPASSLTMVDLPAPFSPTSARTSPGRSAIVASRTARTAPIGLRRLAQSDDGFGVRVHARPRSTVRTSTPVARSVASAPGFAA